jgi:imidazolonepropionase-like amidohydrolase
MPAAGLIYRATHEIPPMNFTRVRRPTIEWFHARRALAAVACLAIVLATQSADGQTVQDGARADSGVAITGVTLIDVSRGVRRPGTTVLVRDGRILAVGRSGTVRVPRGAKVVEGRGRFLIPGLWDAHVHLSFAGEEILPLFIANGVTGVRDVGSVFARTRAMRDRVTAGAVVGPRILTSGPILEGAAWMEAAYKIAPPGSPVWSAGPRVVVSGATVAHVVDSLKAAGVDLIKARNVWGDDFVALAAATRRAGIPLAAHNPNRVNMLVAARAGLRSFEHAESVWGDFDTMTVARRGRMFAEVAKTGALVVPTLMADFGLIISSDSAIEATLADSLGRVDPRNRTLPRVLRRMWRESMLERRKYGAHPAGTYEKITADVRAMHRAGIPFLAGTDVGGIPRVYPGSGLHEELERLVRDGGLSPLDALRSATVNIVRFFPATRMGDPFAPSMPADLVLLDADPLLDIRNVRRIRGVMKGERWFDRAALDALLAEAERTVRATP